MSAFVVKERLSVGDEEPQIADLRPVNRGPVDLFEDAQRHRVPNMTVGSVAQSFTGPAAIRIIVAVACCYAENDATIREPTLGDEPIQRREELAAR